VQKHNSAGGRPKQVAEFVEGKQAASNFVGAMRHILSGQKTNGKPHGSEFSKYRKNGK
jgi:hypothetical protein